MTKIQLLATLLALFIIAMLGACSNEDYSEPDVFKVTPDLRTRINTGVKMASRTEKKLFNEKFNSFLTKCDEMGLGNTPYQYMETEEYADLKNQVLSSSPATCYLRAFCAFRTDRRGCASCPVDKAVRNSCLLSSRH